MSQLIKVVVDLALKNIDKEFDYIVPKKLENKIKIGQIVKVPFGHRKISGFVTQINSTTDLDISKLKEVDSIFYKESFFDQKLLDLFAWVSTYYHAYFAQVIKSALPPGITDKKIKKKKADYLKLNSKIKNYQDKLKKLEKKAPKQHLILSYILKNRAKKNKLKKVLKYAETSRQTVYRLIDKDLVVLYTDIEDKKPARKFRKKSCDKLDFELLDHDQRILDKIILKPSTNEKTFLKNRYLLTTDNSKRRYNFIIKLIEKLIFQGKNTIILIPEINKEINFIKHLEKYFTNEIAILHSKLSQKERLTQWHKIKNGKVKLVLGARSAIFAPFSELDAVIMMEENNENYKERERPLYHARQIAVKRLSKNDSLLVLEAPFPSIESKYLALNNRYEELFLKEQKNKIKTKIIDMRKEIENGNLSDLSQKLKKEIAEQLDRDNKVMIFLNQKGMSNYVICRKCGNVIKCDNCSISLNYHQNKDELRCHYCNLKKEMPKKCPECGSSFISASGLGTEKITKELELIYPDAVIKKVDGDLKEKEITKILNSFREDEIDILVGTSILIKNNFYDKLKFIGVVSADTALNSSDFRAAETNYTLLEELKSLLLNDKESKFLLQSYQPNHYSIKSALLSEEDNFYKQEIELRKMRNYPPYCRLLNIIVSSKDEKKAEKTAKKLAFFLNDFPNKYLEILGAAPAAINKIRQKYRWQLILKFKSAKNREYIIQLIEKKFMENSLDNSIEIRIDVDPYRML